LHELKNTIEEVYKRLVYADNISELGLVVIAVAVIPALCEEFLFRGLLQHTFTVGLNARKGIIITGLFFALFHFNPFSFIALIIIGTYLCFLVYKTNSIIPSIVGHFTNNLAAVTVPYFLGRDDLVVVPDGTNTLFTVSDIISLAFIFFVSMGLFAVSLFMILKNAAAVSSAKN
jgi:membrane protease YdiL (CAAX protease family)